MHSNHGINDGNTPSQVTKSKPEKYFLYFYIVQTPTQL